MGVAVGRIKNGSSFGLVPASLLTFITAFLQVRVHLQISSAGGLSSGSCHFPGRLRLHDDFVFFPYACSFCHPLGWWGDSSCSFHLYPVSCSCSPVHGQLRQPKQTLRAQSSNFPCSVQPCSVLHAATKRFPFMLFSSYFCTSKSSGTPPCLPNEKVQIQYIDFNPDIQDLGLPPLTLASNQTGLFNILGNVSLLSSIRPPLLMLLPLHGMARPSLRASCTARPLIRTISDTKPSRALCILILCQAPLSLRHFLFLTVCILFGTCLICSTWV